MTARSLAQMDTDDIIDLIKQEILANLSLEIRGPHCVYGNSCQEVTVKLMYGRDEISEASFSIPNTPGDR